MQAERVFSSPLPPDLVNPVVIPAAAPSVRGDAQGMTNDCALSLWLDALSGGQAFTLYLWNSRAGRWQLAAATAALAAQTIDNSGVATWPVCAGMPFAFRAATTPVAQGAANFGGANLPNNLRSTT